MIKNTIKKSPLYSPLKFLWGKYKIYQPIKYRYGNTFIATRDLLRESEFWTEDKVIKYQVEQLKKIVLYAYKNIPYYTKLFDRNKIIPEEIETLKDIKKIPYLTKEIINQNINDMIDVTFSNKHIGYGTTGGSIGNPMGFYFDKRISSSVEWAYMTSQWERVGYKHNDKCVILRGNVIKQIINNKKYWQMDWTNNWLIMSSYNLSEGTIPIYVDRIRKFRPKFIQAFPSVLQIIASYMKINRIQPFESVKAIFCGSENVYMWQRELFEEVFQTRVYSWYGHSERVCLAGECDYSHYYHSFPQYGYLELINDRDEWCTEENEKGEIVATGFANYVMPLIRYKTQDIAINTNKKCECGRNWKLIKGVEGRLQDYVIGKNNEIITLTALIFAQHFKAFSKIKNMQLFQNKIGEVVIRIIENKKLQDDDKTEIIQKMKKAANNSLQIFIEFVNDIPRTKSGKYRFLIQKLPVKFGEK